jgi:hypothetical protein
LPNPHLTDVRLSYSHELAEEICQRLAEGETLGSICRDLSLNDPNYPRLEPHKVRKWTREYEDFKTMYIQALIDGAEAMLDQMHEIAENPHEVEIVTEKWSGGKFPKLLERVVRRVDSLERDKLRILVRQHRARMQSPAVQAIEKKSLSVSGDPDAPVTVEIRGGLPPPLGPDDTADPVPVRSLKDPAS